MSTRQRTYWVIRALNQYYFDNPDRDGGAANRSDTTDLWWIAKRYQSEDAATEAMDGLVGGRRESWMWRVALVEITEHDPGPGPLPDP